MKGTVAAALVAGMALALFPSAGRCQKEKVYRTISLPHLERILKKLDIAFKKDTSKALEGIVFYDYQRELFKLRMYDYGGKDLWIEAIFPATSLEQVNRWNQRTKFSRAVFVKEEEGKGSTSLEVQLDCSGGVTEGMVRRFIERFDGDVRTFSKLIKK